MENHVCCAYIALSIDRFRTKVKRDFGAGKSDADAHNESKPVDLKVANNQFGHELLRIRNVKNDEYLSTTRQPVFE